MHNSNKKNISTNISMTLKKGTLFKDRHWHIIMGIMAGGGIIIFLIHAYIFIQISKDKLFVTEQIIDTPPTTFDVKKLETVMQYFEQKQKRQTERSRESLSVKDPSLAQ